mmetsp:Transcript_9823/g.19582  ORF Transcript_9823/g.19582 Transcript_9823/m.19582 type:complete len:331 (-) Transcript_9823:489-1481(-)
MNMSPASEMSLESRFSILSSRRETRCATPASLTPVENRFKLVRETRAVKVATPEDVTALSERSRRSILVNPAMMASPALVTWQQSSTSTRSCTSRLRCWMPLSVTCVCASKSARKSTRPRSPCSVSSPTSSHCERSRYWRWTRAESAVREVSGPALHAVKRSTTSRVISHRCGMPASEMGRAERFRLLSFGIVRNTSRKGSWTRHHPMFSDRMRVRCCRQWSPSSERRQSCSRLRSCIRVRPARQLMPVDAIRLHPATERHVRVSSSPTLCIAASPRRRQPSSLRTVRLVRPVRAWTPWSVMSMQQERSRREIEWKDRPMTWSQSSEMIG